METDRLPNKAAAEYLGISESTLNIWRSNKRYIIPYIKLGNLIFYRKRDLDAFLESRVVEG